MARDETESDPFVPWPDDAPEGTAVTMGYETFECDAYGIWWCDGASRPEVSDALNLWAAAEARAEQAERERDAARAEITALRGELHHVEACNRKLYADSQRLDFMESLRRVTAGFWIHRDDGTGRGFRWMGDGHLRAAIDAARAAAPAEEGA